MSKGRDLLDKSRLLKLHPDLKDLFFSREARYGNLIFSLRHKKMLTQEELAKKSGVPLEDISSLEGGSLPINENIQTYQKIFGLLDMSKDL